MFSYKGKLWNGPKPALQVLRRSTGDQSHAVFGIACQRGEEVQYRLRRRRLLRAFRKWDKGPVVIEYQQTARSVEVRIADFRRSQLFGLRVDIAAAVRDRVFERSKKPFSPMKDIVPDHPMVKSRHAQGAFLAIHGEGTADRGGRSLFIIGIDQERLTHLGGSASKLAQHQNTISIGLAGNVFLCDQVHSIA